MGSPRAMSVESESAPRAKRAGITASWNAENRAAEKTPLLPRSCQRASCSCSSVARATPSSASVLARENTTSPPAHDSKSRIDLETR